mmetsp:Transcript_619/g.1024  ORF Transcript_619/g.1024 Transcript_619/m.1024 type:complete len:94 (-) Transcript_619:321-602(-)
MFVELLAKRTTVCVSAQEVASLSGNFKPFHPGRSSLVAVAQFAALCWQSELVQTFGRHPSSWLFEASALSPWAVLVPQLHFFVFSHPIKGQSE